jgi:hypothetical protein
MKHFFPIPSNKFFNSEDFKKETGFDLYVEDNQLIVVGDCTKAQAQAALNAHEYRTSKLSIADKLASVGLSIEELREALGSN